MSINTKELKIKEGLIDFSNDKITFYSVNIEKGIIDIYLEVDGKRNSLNKFKIILKDYKIGEEGNEFELNINENTRVKVKMIIKNKFSKNSDSFNIKSKMGIFNQNKSENKTQIYENKPINMTINFKDRLKMFNQGNSQKSKESSLINTNIPKKLNNNFLNQFEKKIKTDSEKDQNKNINSEIKNNQESDENLKKEEIMVKQEEEMIVENEIIKEEEKKEEIIIENELNKEEENKEEEKKEEIIVENELNKEEEKKEEIIIENELNKEEENKEEEKKEEIIIEKE